ncbi:hypothetical protein F7725_009159 [Dissostichus mawsoni]|uniref:Uncharacterized protein n=1 Tax=Dissostichus mawsoni TaxID=36200 RepID=A0A7J5Z6S7_DISMA|nr:hypothetical protein F7725_009159 [Dissostichus mawsoni]
MYKLHPSALWHRLCRLFSKQIVIRWQKVTMSTYESHMFDWERFIGFVTVADITQRLSSSLHMPVHWTNRKCSIDCNLYNLIARAGAAFTLSSLRWTPPLCLVHTVLLMVMWPPAASVPCPRPCSCPQPAELHCTFRSLLSIPAAVSKHVERVNLGSVKFAFSACLLFCYTIWITLLMQGDFVLWHANSGSLFLMNVLTPPTLVLLFQVQQH